MQKMLGKVGRIMSVMGVAAGLFVVSVFQSSTSPEALLIKSSTSRKRDLSIALPNGGCEITAAVEPAHQIEATFTASYPGSGAKMTWKLVEALTGYVTGDEWNINGHENMVTVKSHYPHPQGRIFKNHNLIHRAIIILRNPKNAIPSYYNFLYEVKNHLKGHSTRAPVEAWVAWRDVHFYEELDLWKKHTQYWFRRYGKGHRLLISYEGLTDTVAGPIFTTELADFLGRSRGVPVIQRDSVPCIWKTVIQYKGGVDADAANDEADDARGQTRKLQQQKDRHLQDAPPAVLPDDDNTDNIHSLRSGKSFHPYTGPQLDQMIDTFREIKMEFQDDIRLAQIMDAYTDALNGVKEAMGLPINNDL